MRLLEAKVLFHNVMENSMYPKYLDDCGRNILVEGETDVVHQPSRVTHVRTKNYPPPARRARITSVTIRMGEEYRRCIHRLKKNELAPLGDHKEPIFRNMKG